MSAPIYNTGTELVEGFLERVNAHDTTIFSTLPAPGATHEALPKSLKNEPCTYPEVAELFKVILQVVPDFQMTVTEILEGQDKVWFHATSTGTAVDGRKWNNEYVVMLDLVRDSGGGVKISRAREMLDSAFVTSFWAPTSSQ